MCLFHDEIFECDDLLFICGGEALLAKQGAASYVNTLLSHDAVMTHLSGEGDAFAAFTRLILVVELAASKVQKPEGVLCNAAALAETSTPRDSCLSA